MALCFQNRIGDLALFQNFGALCAFCFVNLSVIGYFWIKHRERRLVSHLLLPLFGFAITVLLLSAMRTATLELGCLWLAIGIIHLAVMRFVLHRPVALQT